MRAVTWFRRMLALHQLVYLWQFLPRPQDWFGLGAMVQPQILYPAVFSPLHFLASPAWSIGAWSLAFAGWIFLGLGLLPKPGQVLMLLVQVSLHGANPLIIHEPQQIANFLLLVSIVWPSKVSHPAVPGLRRVMVFALSSYYLLAGLKKLPDPGWLRGDALAALLV